MEQSTRTRSVVYRVGFIVVLILALIFLVWSLVENKTPKESNVVGTSSCISSQCKSYQKPNPKPSTSYSAGQQNNNAKLPTTSSSSPDSGYVQSPKQLVNTGPTGVIPLFLATTLLAGVIHHLLQTKRR